MGGGYYHQDVSSARRSVGTTRSTARAFNYSERATRGEVKGVHRDLNPLNTVRESCDSDEHPLSTPIAVLNDITKSRAGDPKEIFSQLESFMGSLRVSEIVPDPQVLIGAIGDATCDRAPLQLSQFESDRRIDENLKRIWMEAGGGGTGEESYELAAFYLAKRTLLDCVKRDKLGYAFFMGDEAPYDTVSRQFLKTYIGGELPKRDLRTTSVFKKLQERYRTFLIYPRSSMEDRIAGIDEEIRARLKRFGGRFDEVDIRASLIWNTYDDLDLHIITPSGFEIYYGQKRSRCGGELDVDQNVRHDNPKPVENIRWPKGMAPQGEYRVFVQNYSYAHQSSRKEPIPFKVELDIDGDIRHFEGEIRPSVTGASSNQHVETFHYVPGHKAIERGDAHDAYREEVVLAKWGKYIPTSQILRIEDPASCVETMLGAMALAEGRGDLTWFDNNMRERKVRAARRKDVLTALEDYAASGVFTKVDAAAFD